MSNKPVQRKGLPGYYATLEIPKAVRPAFNNKRRFMKSLETQSLALATRRLPILIAQWRVDIEKARGNTTPAANLEWEFLAWKKALENETNEDNREALEGYIVGKLDALEDAKGEQAAQEAAGVVFGSDVLLASELEPWLASITHLAPKTIDASKRTVEGFIKAMKQSSRVTKASCRDYLLHLREQEQLSDKTIGVRITFVRSFLKHIDAHHETDLTKLLTITTLGRSTSATAKTAKLSAWVPFKPSEVSALYSAALAKGDNDLADLIALGAYTGCRIEELGGLRTADIRDGAIIIHDAKSAAGIREVPLHAAIAPLIERLSEKGREGVRANALGFLVPGTEASKYGERASALGKRFGRLKKGLGYSDRQVFHSIRKCVVTQLEQAGVTEGTTADIVGHEKSTITYGLYSSGTSMKQKATAMAFVAYPGELGAP